MSDDKNIDYLLGELGSDMKHVRENLTAIYGKINTMDGRLGQHIESVNGRISEVEEQHGKMKFGVGLLVTVIITAFELLRSGIIKAGEFFNN